MKRQQGMSSLLLVLLLFVMGSLLLQGTGRQYQTLLTQVTFESKAIRESALSDSLLQWGRVYPWQTQQMLQCRQTEAFSGRVCLRIFPDAPALLIAVSGNQHRWLSGRIRAGKVQFDPHGWSDFCPRKEVQQCQQP